MITLEKSLDEENIFRYRAQSIEREKMAAINKVIKKKQKHKQKYIIIATLTGFIIIGSSFSGFNYYKNNVDTLYHVYLDGQEIGTINNKLLLGNWENQFIRQAQKKFGSYHLEKLNVITYGEEKKYKGEYNNAEVIKTLNNQVEIQANAVELNIDGKVVGVVKDQDTAQRLLEKLKEPYRIVKTDNKKKALAASVTENNKSETEVKTLKKIKFKQSLTLKNKTVQPSDIQSEAAMLTLLQRGTLENEKYFVQQGDTISGIALKFGLDTDEIFQLNPALNSDLIHVGDEINVTAIKPYLTVQTVEEISEEVGIPHKIIYHTDDTMFVNEKKVIEKGIEGIKQVNYNITKENGEIISKEIMNETIILEAKTEVILKGTKKIPERGSGVINWPTNGGHITSYFGQRWGSFHNAIDIAGVKDYNILAADNGVIIFAGWKDGYGNAIIIDHKNGMKTLYGHLSEILVENGMKIAKGQKIGIMGSTGRSTGTHLHFEVRMNDEPKNPLNYVGI